MHGLWRTLFIACLALALPLMAKADEAINYVYPDQSVWTTEIDDQGMPVNPLLRLAEAIFKEAGLRWQASPLPAARMFAQLKSGQANFSMLVKSPALKDCCLISRKPVAGTELRVYWLADMPPIRKHEDLAGKLVIAILGYSYGDLAPFLADGGNGISRTDVSRHQAAFDMLVRKRGDYLLDYAGPAQEVLDAKPIPNLRFTTLGRMDVHLVLSKSYPDAKKTMAKLEAIADKLDREKIIRGK